MRENARAIPLSLLSILIALSTQAELGRDWVQVSDELPYYSLSSPQSVVLDNTIWLAQTTYGPIRSSSDGINWTRESFSPDRALSRGQAWSAHNGGIYMMGGYHPDQAVGAFISLDSVWRYVPFGNWTEMAGHAPWPRRHDHAAVTFNGEIWLLGGGQAGHDVWRSPDGINWQEAVHEAPWSWRIEHSAVVHDRKIWVLGGRSFKGEPTTSATVDVNLAMDAEVIGPIDPDSIAHNWRLDFAVFNDQGLEQDVYIYFAKVRDGDPLALEPTNWLWEWRVQDRVRWFEGGPYFEVDLGGTLEFNDEGALVSARQFPEDTDGINTEHYFEVNFGNPINQGGTGLEGTTQFAYNFQDRETSADNGSSERIFLNDVWFSHNGINWTEADTLKSPQMWQKRSDHKAIVCEGKMWVMGGHDYGSSESGDNIYYTDIWYTSDGGIWRKATDEPSWPIQYTGASTVFVFKDSLCAIAKEDIGPGEYNEGVWRSYGVPWLTIVNQPRYHKGDVVVGREVYEDRGYKFADPVPADLKDQVCIRALNDDKGCVGADWLVLEVDRPVTVYVAHDARFPAPPAWLSSWTKRGDTILTSDAEGPERVLYQREFPAGTIELGGNIDPGMPDWLSMYSVIVVPIEEPTRADSDWTRFQ